MLFGFCFFSYRQKDSQNQKNICPSENVATHFPHRSALNLDFTEADMDTLADFDDEHDIPSVSSNKWVIGPFFQSLKSKISSFTEIVMSPVKVFKANSFPSHNEDKPQAFETSQAQSESGTEDTDVMEGAPKAQSVVHSSCKKLKRDLSAQNFGQADESEKTLVPLRQSPSPCIDSVEVLQSIGPVFAPSIPLCPPVVAVRASEESKLKMPSAEEELRAKRAARVKPLLRKGTGNRKKGHLTLSDLKQVESYPEMIDVQLPVTHSLNPDKDDPGDDEAVLFECDGRKRENGHLVDQSLRCYLRDDVNGRILRSTADNQAPPNTAAGHSTAKQEATWDAWAQNAVKRKRVTADECSRNAQAQKLQRPTRKRQAVSANKRGNHDGEMLTAISETVPAETGSFQAGLVRSLKYSSGVTEQSWKGSSHAEKPKKSRGPRMQACFNSPDLAADDMDLETTIAIRSTKQPQTEQLAEVLCGPRDPRSVRESKENAKNPQKRKSPPHAAFSADSENMANLLEVRSADLDPFASLQAVHSCKIELKPVSKRPKNALKSSPAEVSHDTKKVNLKTKENRPHGSSGSISASSIHFEMAPSDSSPQAFPRRDCYVKLDQVMLAEDGRAKDSAPAAAETFSTNTEPANGADAPGLNWKASRPRKDNRRRKCRVLPKGKSKVDEVENCISKDDSNLAAAAASKKGRSRRLQRSYSCPEISTLHSSDASWNSLHHARIQPSHQHARAGPHHARNSVRRARRHTVCSVEVEREIAPLCLRKEVYPSRRPAPYEASNPSPLPSFSTSLSALASCFLSSPLAFLSTKSDGRESPAGPSTPSHVSSPTSLFICPAAGPLSGFIQQPDSSCVVMDPR